MRSRLTCAIAFVCLFCHHTVGGAEPPSFEQARAAFDAADWPRAAKLLKQEVDRNPGHQLAYILLARALEGAGDKDGANKSWTTLLDISRDEAVRREARKGFIRTRAAPPDWGQQDPFHVPNLDIDYRGLEEVDNENYVTPPGSDRGIPPIEKETKHFTIYCCNEKLANTLADICEKYLAHLLDRYLDGRAWPHRVPILCYKDRQAYVSAGKMPDGSLGVTIPNPFGRPFAVAFFQIATEEEMEAHHADNPVKGNIEDTLPHELTHMVLMDYFGDQNITFWIHEGCARQMEQNRKDLEETADMARDAVSGEFIRFRDLFESEGYPGGKETLRFYDQSATIVTYLLKEHGPESFRAFLDEIRDDTGYDTAAAAALGIDETGAVEELERRWVAWMRERYAKDLKADEKAPATLAGSDSPVLRPAVKLKETMDSIKKWTDLPMRSLDDFRDVEGSAGAWKVEGGKLRCIVPDGSPAASLLGIKILEDPPLILQGKVKRTEGRPGAVGYFGFAQLNLKGDDLGVQVLAPLPDTNTHEVLCLFEDDLTLFLDGQCVARYPAVLPPPDEADIDFPLAFVAHAPVQVWDIRTAAVKEFVLQSLQEKKEGENPGDANRDPGRGS